MRRERDDRDGDAESAQAARGGVAIHHRHGHVHQDQVERLGGDALERHPAVVDHGDLGARLAQHHRDEALIVGAVLGQEDARLEGLVLAAGPARLAAELRLAEVAEHARVRRRLRLQREGEHAPLPRLALDRAIAAQQDRDALGDRETEACTTEAPRDRAVRLLERAEQVRELLGRDADAGVSNLEVRAFALGLVGDAQLHRAPLGELDRIAEQVHDRLADARRIREHLRGDRRREGDFERDALLVRAHAHERRDLRDDVHETRRDPLHIEPAGFDLRQVEDVVQYVEQMTAVAAHDFEQAPRLLAELHLLVEQEVRVAEDRRHRRADLVTHVGEKRALGAIRALRVVARRLELDGPLGDLLLERRSVRLELAVHAAQLAGHVVERAAEVAELARAQLGHLRAEIARAHAAHRRAEQVDAAQQVLPQRRGEPDADDEGARQHERARGQQLAVLRDVAVGGDHDADHPGGVAGHGAGARVAHGGAQLLQASGERAQLALFPAETALLGREGRNRGVALGGDQPAVRAVHRNVYDVLVRERGEHGLAHRRRRFAEQARARRLTQKRGDRVELGVHAALELRAGHRKQDRGRAECEQGDGNDRGDDERGSDRKARGAAHAQGLLA